MDNYKFRYIFKNHQTGDVKSKIITIDDMEENKWGAIPDWEDDGYQLASRDRHTGLKDCNGKEIYEGDICKDSLDWSFVVEWDNDNSRFIGRHSKPRGDTYICYVGRVPAVEVMGNRWDNPELLGEVRE